MHFKLQNKPELLKEYDQIIKEQLSSVIVEEVPEKKIEKITNIQSPDAHSENIHYVPHHAVIGQNRETTKLRVVYDCSAKSNNQPYALNDCLETGPNYIPQLLEVLLRFRWNPIAISADIEKAFLMVGINRNDRDMLRFLWLKNPYDPRSDMIHLRFCRLMFGLRPSPAILGAVLAYHLNSGKQYDPELVELIKNSMYVDDFLSGSGSVAEGKEIYSNCKQIIKEASFNLRKWHSNFTELLEFIDEQETNEHSITNTSRVEGKKVTEEDESYAKTTVGKNLQSKAKSVNILGSTWNVETDEFHFQLSELITLAKSLPLTKRSFLRVSSKFFDPLGILSPFTILLKVAFQSICVEGLDWDEELQNPYRRLWNSFLSDITQLERLRVPRCYFNTSTNPTNKQFHSFSDASKKAFAAVTYLRSTYPDGQVETRLVAAKTRVAIIKTQTIPRLELLGAVISARLSSTITRSLPNNDEIECIYWTDSTTTLQWIQNDKHWRQYVQQRVQEIRQLTPKEQWRHCPGSENPADLPSPAAEDLIDKKLWLEGPEFLKKPESEWPSVAHSREMDESSLKELVKSTPHITHSFVNIGKHSTYKDVSQVIDYSNFSSLKKLLRVTAYVLRFIRRLRSKENDIATTKELNASEIRHAETCWIKGVQMETYEHEIRQIQLGGTTPLVKQFNLFIDENNILCCEGRIHHSTVAETAKRPILLPTKHH